MLSDYETKAFSTIQEAQLNYWSKIRHPFVAGLELTPNCNLRCVHCYMQEYTTHDMLSAEEWKSIIDKLFDAGVLILYMTGGEIFTRKDFIEIYTYAKKKGFIIELLTNVTCCNDAIIEVFKEYPPAVVSISVYGMSPEVYQKVTGSKHGFDAFKRNLQKLQEADIDVELKFIGLTDNVHEFEIARDFANQIGAKFKFNFEIFPTLNGDSNIMKHRLSNAQILEFEKNNPEVLRALVPNIEKKSPFLNRETVPLYTCNVASTLCYIDSLGYVSPCNKMRLKEHNILAESLKDIWQDYIDEYAKMAAPETYPCARCPHSYICSPCPVINKLSTGSCYTPCADSCELTKMRVAEFTKEEYKKYKL